MKYAVVLEQGSDGVFVASAAALPGCVSQGDSRDQALSNIREAIEMYIEDCREAGDPLPPEEGKAFDDFMSAGRAGTPSRSSRADAQLPVNLSGLQVRLALEREGFVFRRQTANQMILRRDSPYARAIVPDRTQIRPETLGRIIADAGLSIERFLELLGR